MQNHSSSITAVRFAANGKMLISSGADQSIVFRNIGWQAAGPASDASTPSFAVTQAQKAGMNANLLHRWRDQVNADCVLPMRRSSTAVIKRGTVSDLAVHPTNRFVATCGGDAQLHIWSMTGKQTRAYKAGEGSGQEGLKV